MASIFEIDQEMMNLIDSETGELLDFERFSELEMQKNIKVENMALWYKSLCAEAEAIKNEISALSQRVKTKENTAQNLKEYLSKILNGQKFESPKCRISYRKSSAVEIENEEYLLVHAKEKYLTKRLPVPNKAVIKEALKDGEKIDGARLVEKQNMTIK